MNASEFIKKLKEAIKKEGYKPSELTFYKVDSNGSNCHEVYLYDKNDDLVYVVLEKEKNLIA